MASTTAWVLNLDAEDELAHPSGGHVSSAEIAARISALIPRLGGLIGPNDVVIGSETRLDEPLPGRAWCPTPSALEKLRRAGAIVPHAPGLEVLRRVNHRRFSAELGQQLEHAGFVETEHALDQTLSARPGQPWLLKRPFSYAGRGRRRVVSGAISESERSWIRASLRAQGGLQVEPELTILLDVSIHGELEVNGRWMLGVPTIAELRHGAWVTSRPAARHELSSGEESALLAEAERSAQALHAAGYFGPFNIDAFRYASDAGPGFCARCEINARYSMGYAVGMGLAEPELES